ncbi:MAG: thiamine pyrophosphate-binding protein [Chloroflexi bacterium]|nr:thiamine pyrophosphate-binding protein [Chloroflexota bacterium]
MPDLGRRLLTPTPQPRGDSAAIARAAHLLVEAARPVIHAGGGAILSQSSEEVLALAEYLAAPVTTTMAGKGAVPESHPLSAGTTGRAGTPMANAFAAHADVVLALGTQFPEQDSSSWHAGATFSIPPTRLIQVDLDPYQLGKIYPLSVGIVGDVRSVLRDLRVAVAELTPPRDWHIAPQTSEMARQKDAWRASLEPLQSSSAMPIRPERLLATVRSVLPPEGIVVGDVGWGKNGVAQQYPAERPQTTFVASGYGTMGFAAAAALGVRLARPDVPVISLTGDGGMSSLLCTLITGVEHNLAVVWVVFNNAAFGAIGDIQKHHFGRGVGCEFSRADTGEIYSLDFAAIARACGAEGHRVIGPDELRPALVQALEAGRPYVLDVVVERNAQYQPTGYWDVGDIYAGY